MIELRVDGKLVAETEGDDLRLFVCCFPVLGAPNIMFYSPSYHKDRLCSIVLEHPAVSDPYSKNFQERE